MIYLEIVEANHMDSQIYILGGAGFETEEERAENLATIPAFNHDCDNDDKCYLLQIVNADGFTDGEREISEATAKTLLGVDDLGPLHENEKQMLGLFTEVSKPTEQELGND